MQARRWSAGSSTSSPSGTEAGAGIEAVAALPPHLDHQAADRERLRLLGRKVRKRLAARRGVRRIAADKGELWAVPKFLDEVECGRLISIIDAVARPSEA